MGVKINLYLAEPIMDIVGGRYGRGEMSFSQRINTIISAYSAIVENNKDVALESITESMLEAIFDLNIIGSDLEIIEPDFEKYETIRSQPGYQDLPEMDNLISILEQKTIPERAAIMELAFSRKPERTSHLIK